MKQIPLAMSRKLARRFWSYVSIGDKGECWEWKGGKNELGYGRFGVGGQTVYAHRYSLALELGRDLKDGWCACHRCDNPSCCNPSHLFEGTQKENIQDSVKKGRFRAGQTHCPNGHEYTPENTLEEGSRRCRICRDTYMARQGEEQRKWRARIKLEEPERYREMQRRSYAKQKKWRDENRDEFRKQRREYQRRPEVREKARKYQKERYHRLKAERA